MVPKLVEKMRKIKIFATDINETRLNFARKIGSDYVINAKNNVVKELNKLNDGNLADFVFLCLGLLILANAE